MTNQYTSKGEYKNCKTCNKEMYVSPSLLNRKKYCSKKCFNENKERIETQAKKMIGHKSYTTPESILKMKEWRKTQIMSKEHKQKISDSRIGNKNHNWKGGISFINKSRIKNRDYKLWRKACFERDNYTCQKYKVSGGKLIVHHINNFADYPLLRTSIENGITLSEKAHKEFHKIYGVKNNTKEQLIGFLNK